jgi:hypothetical protein
MALGLELLLKLEEDLFLPKGIQHGLVHREGPFYLDGRRITREPLFTSHINALERYLKRLMTVNGWFP